MYGHNQTNFCAKLRFYFDMSKKKCNFAVEMKRNTLIFANLVVLLPLLLLLDLFTGATHLSLSSVLSDPFARTIFLSLRLPRALTAILAGVALSVSGLEMQTLFRNPLAGPYVLGVSSGATLGVALLLLLGTFLGFVPSAAGTVLFAIAGALLVLLCVLAVQRQITSTNSLLIVGLMIGAIAGALVNILQNIADPDSLKLFVVWTLGSLSSVSWNEWVWLFPLWLTGMLLAVRSLRTLGALALGDNNARALGINLRTARLRLIASTGLLAGGITAFCGPIAFVGIAVPYVARLLLHTSNHRLTMPVSCLLGADLMLLCDTLSSLGAYPLPISTVSALFGAPVVVAIIWRNR